MIELTNAFVAFLFAASAPVAIILGAGVKGGLSQADLASWIFAAFAVNGALTIAMSIAYRQPLAFFWTIPGAVLVGNALRHLTLDEVIGAYLLTAALLLALGLTGWVKRVMDRVPMPIVMGMVAGVFLDFGLDWIESFSTDPILVVSMTAAFLVLFAAPGARRRILQGALQTAFGQRFALGSLIAFLVSVGAPSIFGIGAPFWGLVFGFATSALLERGDFMMDERAG